MSEAQNRVVAAQAADELLTVAGVSASVVLYPTQDGGVAVSARSIGDMNVQVLLEKLGGGGNKSAARRPDAGHVSAGRGQPALRRHRQLLGYGLRP